MPITLQPPFRVRSNQYQVCLEVQEDVHSETLSCTLLAMVQYLSQFQSRWKQTPPLEFSVPFIHHLILLLALGQVFCRIGEVGTFSLSSQVAGLDFQDLTHSYSFPATTPYFVALREVWRSKPGNPLSPLAWCWPKSKVLDLPSLPTLLHHKFWSPCN